MKLARVAVATATAVVGLALAPGAHAENEKVTVPKAAGKTASTSFAGKFPLGTNLTTFFTSDPNGSCKDSPFKSEHAFKVVVPAGVYKALKAKMYVTVTGENSVPLAGDFIEVLDPAGNSMGMDGQHGTDEVEVSNPVAGTWKLVTCQFVPDSAGDHPYKATVTIKTKKK